MSQPITSPWYMRAFFSRGSFSPRLLAAWVTLGYTFRVIEFWLKTKPVLLGNTLVLRPDIGALVLALLGLVTALFGLGTIQKTVLGDAAPATGFAQEAEPSSPAQSANTNAPNSPGISE